MIRLSLAGLSEDKRRLLLVSDTGEQFTLVVDDKLRAALRGEHARIGQLEITMESALRPKDIQARIRAGATPEAVAQAAQTTVDKILPFANPVLAERAHVAQRAQRSSVRRKTGDSGARTLGDAVAGVFSRINVHSDTISWDAWRREDGRWTLTGEFATPQRKGIAKFTFDAPGNYVVTENDDARWLVGEAVAEVRAPRDDLQQARQRRLAPAPDADELPLGGPSLGGILGDDALDLANGAPDLAPTPEPLADEPVAHVRSEPSKEPARKAEPAPDPADQPVAEAEPAAAEEAPAEPARPARKKGRASVPSWDEIMFGGGRSD